ncbi:MAG: anhydro-N-acetylmuramic acid kinase, partial [Nitrospirales bacterium]
KTIVEACGWFKGNIDEVILGGGGVNNLALMDALRQAFAPRPVRTMDQVGGDSNAFEALAFAVMAYQTIHGVPTNVPAVTGARYPVVLGMVVPGKKKFSIHF